MPLDFSRAISENASALGLGVSTASFTGSVTATAAATATTVMTIALPAAGTWEIAAQVQCALSAGQEGSFALFDPSGNMVPNTVCKAGYVASISYQGQGSTVWRVTTTGAANYTVRAWGPGSIAGCNILHDLAGQTYALWKKLADPITPFSVTYTESLTITGSVTNPVKSSAATIDKITVIDDGSGFCHLHMAYFAATAPGASNGNGTFLVLLPGGLKFDTTYHKPNTQLGLMSDTTGSEIYKMIPGSDGIISHLGVTNRCQAVPHDATHFKIMTRDNSLTVNSGYSNVGPWQYWASGLWGMTAVNQAVNLTYVFKKG